MTSPESTDSATVTGSVSTSQIVALYVLVAAGYWCYNNGGCNDSSTTQLVMAGLAGLNYRTSAKLSFNLDYEGASAGRTGVLICPADGPRLRFRDRP